VPDIPAIPIEPSEFIPQDWPITVRSFDELVHFGKHNLTEMEKYWADYHLSVSGQLAMVNEMRGFFERGSQFLRELASQYERPEIPKRDYYDSVLEPVDAQSMLRKAGATTFNICGWCTYAKDGFGQFNWQTNPRCSLLEMAQIDTSRRSYDSECALLTLESETFARLVANFKSLSSRLRILVSRSRKMFKMLMEFQTHAQAKPLFPFARPVDWFELGDRVVCLLGRITGQEISKYWVMGTIVAVDQSGSVTVCTDQKLEGNDELAGYGLTFSHRHGGIVKLWEAEYLNANPEYRDEIWTQSLTSSHAIDLAQLWRTTQPQTDLVQ
jgi:hypothetical protein